MRALRTATVITICLWLVLPGTQTFALCFGHDGGVALEHAAGHACGCSEDGDGAPLTRAMAIEASATGCCGDCTDVVLNGAEAAVTPADVTSKHTREQRTDEATQAVSHGVGSHLQTGLSVELHSLVPSAERPSATGFTILRL